MRIICTERELLYLDTDEIVDAVELVQEDVVNHGVKQSDYQIGNIIIEVEE